MTCRFMIPLALCFALPAYAQGRMSDLRCDDSQRLTQTLTTVLGAERRAMGLRDPDTMLEVWVENKSGDWMIVQNYSNGTSCIVAIGEHWEGALTGPA